jgi:hypothetical protein
MVQSGHNPARRNRNIGTAKQGLGQANRMKIPSEWDGKRWYFERMDDAIAIERKINGHRISFLVQPTTAGFLHPCTVGDLCHLLACVPAHDLMGIERILLRQPTRKEQSLDPVWGRVLYREFAGKYSGYAIVLEALEPGKPIRWSRSLTPGDAAELALLKRDGHAIAREKRHLAITPTLKSARRTQLYRTALHELGHHVDFRNRVSDLATSPADYSRRRDAYFARPWLEREAQANAYAEQLARQLEIEYVIPFARMDDRGAIERDGLDPAWFLPADAL